MDPVLSISQPELFPDVFPEGRVPQIRLEGERASFLPESVWVTETTHRDGQQSGIPFTTEQAVAVYELMDRIGGPGRVIRQAEFFIYARSDRDAYLQCWRRYSEGRTHIEPTVWIRSALADVRLLRGLPVREAGLLCSASDYHTFFKFKPGGRAQAARTYLDAIRMTLDAGIRPRVHLEDVTRAPWEGFVLPFIRSVEELAQPYGESLAPRYRLSDTLGIGLPFWEASLPRSVPRLVRAVITEAKISGDRLEIHTHNDTGFVVANSIAAVAAGCAAVNGCLLGRGERTGNAPLELVLFNLLGLYPDLKPDLIAVGDLVKFYAEIGEAIPPKHPLFGSEAHLTRAGIHADALQKNRRTYTYCDTEKILGRSLEVLVSKESGLGGVSFMIQQRTGKSFSKDDPRVKATWRELENAFAEGRMVAYGWDELRTRVFPKTFPELSTQANLEKS